MFVPVEEVFPGTEANERTLLETFETLSRDDTLFQCARINIIVSGQGVPGCQITAVAKFFEGFCTPEQLNRIKDFANRHPNSGSPVVFMRGQLLELMRWAARYCKNLPNDRITYQNAAFRQRFLKAALIASTLWGRRSLSRYAVSRRRYSRTSPARSGSVSQRRGGNRLCSHLGVAIARGLILFRDYLPRYYPDFADAFQGATGLSLPQYLACAVILSPHTLLEQKQGPLFSIQTNVDAVIHRDVFPKFLSLESQSPEELSRSFWENVETQGYSALRERPIMVTDDGRSVILDPTFSLRNASLLADCSMSPRPSAN